MVDRVGRTISPMSINALHFCIHRIHRTSQYHQGCFLHPQELDRTSTQLRDMKQSASEKQKVIQRLEAKLDAAKKEKKEAKQQKKEKKHAQDGSSIFPATILHIDVSVRPN